MEARRFRLYAASELSAVDAALLPVFERWALEWFRLDAAISIASRGVLQGERLSREPGSWIAYGDAADQALLIGSSSEEQRTLALAIAGDAAKIEPVRLPLTPLVADLVDAARDALSGDLAGAAVLRTSLAGVQFSELFEYGFGSVICEVSLSGAGSFSVLIPAARAEQLIGKPISIRSLSDTPVAWSSAFAEQRVSAKVVLGACEISLAELALLGEGDTLLLDTSIDRNFALTTNEGTAIVPVTIGKKGPQVAAVVKRTM